VLCAGSRIFQVEADSGWVQGGPPFWRLSLVPFLPPLALPFLSFSMLSEPDFKANSSEVLFSPPYFFLPRPCRDQVVRPFGVMYQHPPFPTSGPTFLWLAPPTFYVTDMRRLALFQPLGKPDAPSPCLFPFNVLHRFSPDTKQARSRSVLGTSQFPSDFSVVTNRIKTLGAFPPPGHRGPPYPFPPHPQD